MAKKKKLAFKLTINTILKLGLLQARGGVSAPRSTPQSAP